MNITKTDRTKNTVIKSFAQTSLLLFLAVPFLGLKVNAAPKLLNDPVFNQATMIGKVFFDSNLNGILDNGELGIPGVRVATVTGLVMETDAYGRFHIPDGKVHNSRFGQNQLLKIDVYSLPQGAQITSENPRLLRIHHPLMNKINFGVIF